MKVAILGLGYVGLPLYTAIASTGKYNVVGYDPSKQKVQQINKRECPIDDRISAQELKELEKIEVDYREQVLKDSDIFIICVPTPVLNGYIPDYTYVEQATTTVAKYLSKGGMVVLESTVNPGTCDEIVISLLEKESNLKVGKDFAVAHCPERINPGDNKWSIYNIPRNIGAFPQSRVKEAADFYRSFIEASVNEVSSLKVAEATKIIENTFRDINIAFVNELAKSFDRMEIDLVETIQGASNKPFGFMAHWPGRGVGGHCIAVDPYYLIKKAETVGFDHRFLKLARQINNSMPAYTVERLLQGLAESKLEPYGLKVAVLGLSYKPNVHDLRESPSFEIIELLKEQGFEVVVFDPFVKDKSDAENLEEALEKVDAVVVATAHDEFLQLPQLLKKRKNIKVVVDGQNKLDQKKVEQAGVVYRGIGR